MINHILPYMVASLSVLTAVYCILQPVVLDTSGYAGYPGMPKCEEITIPMCRGIGYNMTSMPNELNHDSQEEAGFEVHQFWPLVEVHCSHELKFFLCSMYVPICFEDYHKSLKACRGICQRAREGCEPLMLQYGFQWPERMDCDKLPVQGGDVMCMEPSQPSLSTSPNTVTAVAQPPKFKNSFHCKGDNDDPSCKNTKISSIGSDVPAVSSDCSCKCRLPLIKIDRDSNLFNRNVSVAGINNCAYPCHSMFFSKEEERFTNTWLTTWAFICCLTTVITLLTFLIDMERFKYPERPIIFLSGCYLMVSIGFICRIFLGHEKVACEFDNTIAYNATGPTPCIMVFLLLYFFGMASSIWWVILTFGWFLAAGCKWSNEAIASYSLYFHLAAWLIPTIKSVAVLITGAVDGDPVAGICYVGNQNADNLKKFVLAPLVVYLFLGITFLIGGFVSLYKIKRAIRRQSGVGGRAKADKLEKLMIRMGIFSVLYVFPSAGIISCYFYEASLSLEWNMPLLCPCLDSIRQEDMWSRPIYAIYMMKYFMALAVGITSGVWVWSGKTLTSWGRLCGGGRKQARMIAGGAHGVSNPQYVITQATSNQPGKSCRLQSSPSVTPLGNHPRHVAMIGNHQMFRQSQPTSLSHV